MLGISVHRNRLLVRPAAPSSWPGFSFTYRYGTSVYEIEVVLDGAAVEPAVVDLIDDGHVHHVRLEARGDVAPAALAISTQGSVKRT